MIFVILRRSVYKDEDVKHPAKLAKISSKSLARCWCSCGCGTRCVFCFWRDRPPPAKRSSPTSPLKQKEKHKQTPNRSPSKSVY